MPDEFDRHGTFVSRGIAVVRLARLVNPAVDRFQGIDKMGFTLGVDPPPDVGLARDAAAEKQRGSDEDSFHKGSCERELCNKARDKHLISVTEISKCLIGEQTTQRPGTEAARGADFPAKH